MLAAGLSGEDAHVDQAGAQNQAFAVDDLRVRRIGVVEQTRADIGDAAVLDQEPAAHVEVCRRIDQARVAEGDALAAHARPRASASSTAMRIATPISTCSWMRLTSRSSATVELISTPRFIGPGCITSAPGLASASFSRSRP